MKFEGHEIEKHHATFTGSWDLEDEDAERIGLDRVVVFLVAGRISKSTLEIEEKSGELHRKNVIKVSDTTMLGGSMRDQALSFIVHGPDQAQMNFGVPQYTGAADTSFDLPDEAPANGNGVPVGNSASPSTAGVDPQEVQQLSSDQTEGLGSVYPGGKRKDEQLDKFLADMA